MQRCPPVHSVSRSFQIILSVDITVGFAVELFVNGTGWAALVLAEGVDAEQTKLSSVVLWVLLVAPCAQKVKPASWRRAVVSREFLRRYIVLDVVGRQGGIPDWSGVGEVFDWTFWEVQVRNRVVMSAGDGVVGM